MRAFLLLFLAATGLAFGQEPGAVIPSEHLGIDADLMILRVVLIDGEVVFVEETEQFREEQRREIQRAECGRVLLKEAAVQVGQARFGEPEKIALAVGGVERLEEKRGEVKGMEAVGLRMVIQVSRR